MWPCLKCREKVADSFDLCWNCGTSRDGTEDPSFRRADSVDPVPAVAEGSAGCERTGRLPTYPLAVPDADRSEDVRVTIGDIDISFWSIFSFLFKFQLASLILAFLFVPGFLLWWTLLRSLLRGI
jgi:hypothetical protein